ncbi:MAG: hypothetical protein Q8O26_14420 [Phreatobacter sp.]|uniref:hypothetical protein n=1 Tax=Phreatobacter sp. TaxID=1966341 RepID=UPI002732830E|nr:hypothetical protein [Phreatobacter sp.]MDP2803067.1 hypothetical protein [Phreatobacter sp.]
MDVATDPPFAMVSPFPMGPRDRSDPQRHLPQMAALLRERYQGATIQSQKVEPRLAGPVATVVFLRTPPGQSVAVAGAAFPHFMGNAAVFMVAQFQTDRQEFIARFIRVRDGVNAR